MKAEYINPFIESVHELFSTMLGCSVKRENLELAASPTKTLSQEIVAIIGLNGEARGTVTITFPEDTALAMASCLLGEEKKKLDESVSDTVAEIVNIITGGAKAKLSSEFATPLELSLPTVIKGKGYAVAYPQNTLWFELPFTSDLGPFQLRLTFEKVK